MSAKVLSITLLIALAVSLALLGKLGWNNYQLRQERDEVNTNLMQAKLDIGRAHTKLGNAEARIGELSLNLQEEVKALKASVVRYADLEAEYRVLKKKAATATITYYPSEPIEVPCPDTSFIRGLLYEAITETTLAPVKQVKATMEDERIEIVCLVEPVPNMERRIPFKFGYILHFLIRGKLIETKNAAGVVNHFLELYEIDQKGNELGKLELTKFEVVVNDETAPHFMWWAPHVDVGILGGWNTSGTIGTGGSIGFSLMGYGRTTNDLTWRYPRISMDLSGRAGIGLTPVLYNVGDPIPLISNIWVGPHLMWGFGKEAMLGLFVGGVL